MSDNVLAIDLGKSRCRAALFQNGDRVEVEGHGAPGLTMPNGAALAEAAILAVTAPLLTGSMIDHVGVGAAGALAAPASARFLAERLCVALPARRVAVGSDAATSHLGAFGGQPGLVLAVGTGVVAIMLAATGEARVVDGNGPWLGDDGGATSIGVSGLRAAIRALDGRGQPTTLSAAAKAEFGRIERLPALIANDSNPAAFAARFAVAVLHCANGGDEVAKQIRQVAIASLAATVRAATRGQPARFALVGGLAELIGNELSISLDCCVCPVIPLGTALDGARQIATIVNTPFESGLVRVEIDRSANPLDLLATEATQPGLDDLDERSPGAIVHLALQAERGAQQALEFAATALAAATEAIAARMLGGGRLFYLGAGTPGRLAVLDAAELGPTFGVSSEQVIPLLAGGFAAMLQSIEGAEDDPNSAVTALEAYALRPSDCVVGITASGRTPFVLGGLRYANAVGALAVAIVNNPGSACAKVAEIAVEILTGPEIVSGSTRMMAGTTQKVALNALSTAVMVALGRTYGPYMVEIAASNAKLRRRARRIVRQVTGVLEQDAVRALVQSNGRVKPAIVALLASVDVAEASRRLDRSGGRVRTAIAEDS